MRELVGCASCKTVFGFFASRLTDRFFVCGAFVAVSTFIDAV